MKYDLDAAQKIVFERGRQRKAQKERRTVRLLSAASGLLAVLIFAIGYAAMRIIPVEPGSSVYGAFLLSQEAGGYVLVGVVCFVAAVIMTLLVIRHRGRETHKKEGEES